MRELLGSDTEFESFLSSYENSPERGIRLNLCRLFQLSRENREVIYNRLTDDWGLTPLPDASYKEYEGRRYYREFYINEDVISEKQIRPGRHPYHEAGLYYIQEPSAMQPVMHLDIREWDRVADICASPGGKSSHAADFLSCEKGAVLLSNEYIGNRARTLSSNIERMGIKNAVVLNEDTKRIAERFPGYFSRVIIDAPCSGEGMFRKDETAIREWSPENVERCIERQREIVANGLSLLSEGGRLSYSTCTFERGENEDMAEYILSLDSDLSLVFEKRIFPHKERGEGHYIAVFEKKGEYASGGRDAGFFEVKEKGRTIMLPDSLPDTTGLRTLRRGVFKTLSERGREIPEHAYSHTSEAAGEYPMLSLDENDKRAVSYLYGLEIQAEHEELLFPDGMDGESFRKGYVLVAVDGAAMGFGGYVNGRIKNHFPKGLRFNK